MKRLALNGSPRGQRSNSRLILGWISSGMAEAGAEPPPILELSRTAERESQLRAFLEAEEVLLVFPLYTDSVPGVVKDFLDSLAGVDPALLKGKRFAFVVHSGFPESIHSEPVGRYLTRLCSRLGMACVGSALKGGSEGLRLMPDRMVGRTRLRFARLGGSLAGEGRFDPGTVALLARPRRLGFFGRLLVGLLIPTGLVDLYWKNMLKKHGGWPRRFDRPYAPPDAAGGRAAPQG